MKILRTIIITLLIIATFLMVAMYIASKQRQSTVQDIDVTQEEDPKPSLNESYPEEVAFIEGYFNAIKAHNYQTLVQSYWQPEVVAEIRNECSSPLGEDPATTTESLWLNCKRFDDVTVEIISVDQGEEESKVTIQFFDADNQIIGLELHPEWVRGHQVLLKQTPVGFRTADWNFLA